MLSVGACALCASLCAQACELLRLLRPCLVACVLVSSVRRLLGESTSPFIVEGDGLTGQRERDRECIRALSSLVAYAIGYVMAAVARHIVYAAIATYCSCSVISGRLHNVRLVWQTSAPTILFML